MILTREGRRARNKRIISAGADWITWAWVGFAVFVVLAAVKSLDP